MTDSAGFRGFPRETVAFLADLGDAEHQHKAWFEDRRDRYEQYWLGTALSLVQTLGARLAPSCPGLRAVARRSGGSVFRIHRDTRFSKDKRPYKDHLDVWLWVGDGRARSSPGLGVRLTATELHYGAGLHGFDKGALAGWRSAVDHEVSGAALVDLLDDLRRGGAVVSGESYKRVPRGFAPDHPRADLLRHGALWASWEGPIDERIHRPEIVDEMVERLSAAWPVALWLQDAIAGGAR